jgi:hypothetical protein
LRVLDFAVGECPSPKAEPRELLARLAQDVAAARPREASEGARKLLAEIASPSPRFTSIADIAAALQDPAIQPRKVTRARRLSQGALAFGPPLALLGAFAFGALPATSLVPLIALASLAALSALAAVPLRGSATLRLFQLAVESRDGRPIGAARLAIRALVPWTPLVFAAARPAALAGEGNTPWIALGAGLALLAAHLAAVLADPSRGLFERATDTRVVAR